MQDELFSKFLEYRDVLYAHRPKTLFLFQLLDKILMELNRCLCDILGNQRF